MLVPPACRFLFFFASSTFAAVNISRSFCKAGVVVSNLCLCMIKRKNDEGRGDRRKSFLSIPPKEKTEPSEEEEEEERTEE